jgi:pimeloyl-ACP methyl ester carboxylesterase
MHLHSRVSILFVLSVLVAANVSAQVDPCPSTTPYGKNVETGRIAQVNGVGIYYETYGAGKPLVLIHGNGGSIFSMRCQINFFAPSFRVIVMDSRAHGKSEDGGVRLTYELMADDLAAVLRQLKIDKADVIGHSDGGVIAFLLALRHPSLVKAIVASGPNLRPNLGALEPWVMPMYQAEVARAENMLSSGDQSKNWQRIKLWTQLMIDEPNIPTKGLQSIIAPVLIMAGDDDVISMDHLVEMYRALPSAQLFIMPGATHFILREEHALYNAAAERFLTRPFKRPNSKEAMQRFYQ